MTDKELLDKIREALTASRQLFRFDYDDRQRPYKYELSVNASVGGLDFGAPWLKVAVDLEQSYCDRLRDFMLRRGHPFEIDNKTLPILT